MELYTYELRLEAILVKKNRKCVPHAKNLTN
jgi:hypothetical protein